MLQYRFKLISGSRAFCGSGKTQIALEYAYRRSRDPACSVFWVHTDNETTFTQDYKVIAKRLGLAGSLDGESRRTRAGCSFSTTRKHHAVVVVVAPYGVAQWNTSFQDETRAVAEAYGKAQLPPRVPTGTGSRGGLVQTPLPFKATKPAQDAVEGPRRGPPQRGRPKIRWAPKCVYKRPAIIPHHFFDRLGRCRDTTGSLEVDDSKQASGERAKSAQGASAFCLVRLAGRGGTRQTAYKHERCAWETWGLGDACEKMARDQNLRRQTASFPGALQRQYVLSSRE
ncbi:hypothetical protein HRG_012288 [Hirsutella rhossiliensis]